MGPLPNVKSTYRIQFSPQFKFSDFLQLAQYMKELGISHVYASPIMEAVPGSVHGYDVTDFSQIREELGGEKNFNILNSSLKDMGIGWIQDFVPNHMAMDTRNPYIRDVLEKGRMSEFSGLFDIYWEHPAFENGKLCFPILDRPYFLELEAGNFSFAISDWLVLRYKGIDIPLNTVSYEKLLGQELSNKALNYFSSRKADKNNQIDTSRVSNDDTLNKILEKLEKSGKNMELSDKVISEQKYSLRERISTTFEINYRRFFAVDGLICLREENNGVFDQVHKKLLSLVESGTIDGIRIDHVDGLFDPEKYLHKLRESAGNVYLIVEKILGNNESLDSSWPVQGTTGYDFLGKVTSLMTSGGNLADLHQIYTKFTGEQYDEIRTQYDLKLETINSLFPAVLDILGHTFWKALQRKPRGRGLTFRGIREAIREMLAHTMIYRPYLSGPHFFEKDSEILKTLIRRSADSRNDLSTYFDVLEIMVDHVADVHEYSTAIQVLQQYMPAVYAKPIEDRLFYIYNRLISLNDVGLNPFDQPASVDDFHDFIKKKMENFPLSINTLSTHDTKVSEDVRSRICVLSEIPSEWEKAVQDWHKINSRFSTVYKGNQCPSANEEFYIYQLILGSFPNSGEELEIYRERILNHLMKSIREAGVHTNWESPDTEYEEHYTNFVKSVLDGSGNPEFSDNFQYLQHLVSYHGFLNTMSQKILQLTVPGIPDTYQGTEIWNFNLVDPDNRREVDFKKITEMHRKVTEEFKRDPEVVRTYLEKYRDGRIKMLVVSVLLNLRKDNPEVFLDGNYLPVHVQGPHKDNIVAFLRSNGTKTILVLVPRLTLSLGRMILPVGSSIWSDDTVTVPDSVDSDFTDVFTGQHRHISSGSKINVGELMESVPFCVLVSS